MSPNNSSTSRTHQPNPRKMRKIHTLITIRKTIIEQIIELYTGKTPNHIQSHHKDFIKEQNEIGWQHFICGRISKSILTLMHKSAHQKLPKHLLQINGSIN